MDLTSYLLLILLCLKSVWQFLLSATPTISSVVSVYIAYQSFNLNRRLADESRARRELEERVAIEKARSDEERVKQSEMRAKRSGQINELRLQLRSGQKIGRQPFTVVLEYWELKKSISAREVMNYYEEVYQSDPYSARMPPEILMHIIQNMSFEGHAKATEFIKEDLKAPKKD